MQSKVKKTSLIAHDLNKRTDLYRSHELAIMKALSLLPEMEGNISEITKKITNMRIPVNYNPPTQEVQVCRRLTDMESAKIVRKSKKEPRPGSSGRKQQVWELTPFYKALYQGGSNGKT